MMEFGALLIARSVVLVAACALAGGLLVEALALPSRDKIAWSEMLSARRQRWLVVWIAVLAAGSLAEMAIQPPSHALNWLGAALRLFVLAALAMLMRLRLQAGWASVALALWLTASRSLQSRSAQLPEWVLPTLTDWLHLSFTALWLGGVGYLALVMTPSALRVSHAVPMLGRAIERFSTLAVLSVLVLGVTGVAQSAGFVVTPSAVLTTDYGRALLVKLALSLPVLALGAFHLIVIRPQMNAWHRRASETAHQAARRFLRSAALESLLAVALLVAVAALTLLPAVSELSP